MDILYTNKKPIAILLAAYNAGKYLAEQIDSLLAQTNQDWTLYIRNDGSKDHTAEIISSYCGKYEKIIEVDKGGGNLGCRDNFFRLLEVVDSEYYMFCDADDVWLENKIELSFNRITDLVAKNKDIPILAHCDAIICDSNLNVISESFWKSTGIRPESFVKFNYLCVCCTVGGAKSIFNKKVKEYVFPLANNKFIFDYWIAIHVSKYGIISVINHPLIKYRQHETNLLGVSTGKKNSIFYKLKMAGSLLKQYKQESDMLKTIGYGSFAKYLFYKIVVVFKIRFLKY